MTLVKILMTELWSLFPADDIFVCEKWLAEVTRLAV